MKKFFVKEFYEIISEHIELKEKQCIIVQHVELLEVDDELSVTLRIKLNWATIFRKGSNERERLVRTPGLFLHANNSKLHHCFTGSWNDIFTNGVWTALSSWILGGCVDTEIGKTETVEDKVLHYAPDNKYKITNLFCFSNKAKTQMGFFI
ncbi:hypothetical protein C1646_671295 [Rhizophagus diaphanus]|nr:hypothetical protein C1646_671295 [Rhizophagus diaphanus] [Rhizophagus sp. MUCL 43196]